MYVCMYVCTVQLKGNLMTARGWQAGQPWVDQQNLSKQVRVPAMGVGTHQHPHCDR